MEYYESTAEVPFHELLPVGRLSCRTFAAGHQCRSISNRIRRASAVQVEEVARLWGESRSQIQQFRDGNRFCDDPLRHHLFYYANVSVADVSGLGSESILF
jgi:hypothetical protein